MVTLFAVAYGIVLHLGAGRVLIRKSATRAIETLLPESFSWKNGFLFYFLYFSLFYVFRFDFFLPPPPIIFIDKVKIKLRKIQEGREENRRFVQSFCYNSFCVSSCKIFSSFIWLNRTIDVYFLCFGLHELCASRYYRNDLFEIGKYIDTSMQEYGVRTFGTSFRGAETNWIEFFTLAETSDRVAEHVLQFRIARDIARRAQLLPLR